VEERFRFYELDAREREKIVDELREELEKRREILLAVVYGSLLRGEPFRDVDVAVYVNIEVDILDYKFRLERKLSESGVPSGRQSAERGAAPARPKGSREWGGPSGSSRDGGEAVQEGARRELLHG